MFLFHRWPLAVALGVAIVAASVVGCGGDTVTTDPKHQGPTAQEALEDLSNMLKTISEEKKRPPTTLAALAPYEGPFLASTLAIQQKSIVYVWGAGLTGGNAVIAYEANAGSVGGYVLLQDGTVTQMTAQEFQAAPKAEKK